MKASQRKAIIDAFDPNNQDCIYHGGRMVTSLGYGHSNVKINGKNTGTTTHRVIYSEFHGIPLEEMVGKVVMHTCDKGWCININHLKLGTHSENMQDMSSKGRWGVWKYGDGSKRY